MSCKAVSDIFSANSLLIPPSSFTSEAKNINILAGILRATQILLIVDKLGSLLPCSNKDNKEIEILSFSAILALV